MSLRFSEDDYKKYLEKRGQKPLLTPANKVGTVQVANTPTTGKPNKTELSYSVMLGYEFPGCRIAFEGITFKLDNGHRYSPDWIVHTPDGILCVEVKARGTNGHRLPSYQRAKLAYDQAKIDFPEFQWRWAEKCGGIWNVS